MGLHAINLQRRQEAIARAPSGYEPIFHSQSGMDTFVGYKPIGEALSLEEAKRIVKEIHGELTSPYAPISKSPIIIKEGYSQADAEKINKWSEENQMSPSYNQINQILGKQPPITTITQPKIVGTNIPSDWYKPKTTQQRVQEAQQYFVQPTIAKVPTQISQIQPPTETFGDIMLKGYAKYTAANIAAGKKIGQVVRTVTPFTLRSELSAPMPYTEEEYERMEKATKPITAKEFFTFGIAPAFGRRYELIKLTDELKKKVDESAKFTNKVKSIIDTEFEGLDQQKEEYSRAIEGYNTFLNERGTNINGTYELNEEDYKIAQRYTENLDRLKGKLDDASTRVKAKFRQNDIKFRETDEGIEITDERIKRMSKYSTISQAYLQEMEKKNQTNKGVVLLGTVGALEVAGWTVALTPITGALAELPVIKQIIGMGKYIPKPLSIAGGITLGAGITGISAYQRYKEYEPIGMGKAGAISGALELVGGYALGVSLINIAENPNLLKNVRTNIREILEDKSGELSPTKRKKKAAQQLIQLEKDVENKIEYTKEQAEFEFKQANLERQKEIIRNMLRRLNELPTKEEKMQGLLNVNNFLKRTIGKAKAVQLVKDIFKIEAKPPTITSYGILNLPEEEQATIQVLRKPKIRLETPTIARESGIERYTITTGVSTRLKQVQKQKLRQEQVQVPMVSIAQISRQVSKQEQRQVPAFSIATLQRQVSKQEQRQIQIPMVSIAQISRQVSKQEQRQVPAFSIATLQRQVSITEKPTIITERFGYGFIIPIILPSFSFGEFGVSGIRQRPKRREKKYTPTFGGVLFGARTTKKMPSGIYTGFERRPLEVERKRVTKRKFPIVSIAGLRRKKKKRR